MKLKDVFLYLYNSGSENIKNTNIIKETITIESDSTIQISLSKIPYSSDHIFTFKNGEYFEFDYSLNQNRIDLNDPIFNQGDNITVFYFDQLSNTNIPITATLDVDTFTGGENYYILRIGALDSNYILVAKNGKVQHDYNIVNGVLTISDTKLTDKITVYYLNRGYIERRSKLSLKQLETGTIDTRYIIKRDTYSKSEVDQKLSNLNGGSSLGLDSLNALATAIDEHPDYYQYVQDQLQSKSNLGHSHNDSYFTRFELTNTLYDYIDNGSVFDDADFNNDLDDKINKSEVYTRDDIDLIISTLPGNTTSNRGVFIGGGASRETADTNIMDIINISTQSNALFFGTFSTNRRGMTGLSNGLNNIGIISGGDTITNNTGTTSMFSMNVLNATSVSYFSDLARPRYFAASESNGTNNIGIILSGNKNTQDIEYILIGNSYSSGGMFGQLSVEAKETVTTAVSSGRNDRIVFGPIIQTATTYVSEYITPSTLSNSTLFGTLESEIKKIAGTSNDMNDTGVFVGGVNVGNNSFSNHISSINIANLSNAVSFGVLDTPRSNTSAVSNGTNNRGVFGGGNVGTDIVGYSYTKSLEYVNINSPSNSMDFGELTLSRGDGIASISNSAL